MHNYYSMDDASGEIRFNLTVQRSLFVPDALVFDVARVSDAWTAAGHTYVNRDDAVDLAWSILEHYGVAERPPTPLVVGDFVELTGDSISGESNRLGKIVSVASHTEHFSIRGIGGEFLGWRSGDELGRLTKEEFLAKASARAAKFVGEG